MDEYILPPIIEQQIGQSKIFMLYFRTRGALIDAIIVKIFDDDEVATPPPSPLPALPPVPLILDSRTSGIRYINYSLYLL